MGINREHRAAAPTVAVARHTVNNHTSTVEQCRDACTQTEKAAVVESNEELMIARVVDLIIGLMKRFLKYVTVDESKVLETVKCTTGCILKNKKNKPPRWKTRGEAANPTTEAEWSAQSRRLLWTGQAAEARRERDNSSSQ